MRGNSHDRCRNMYAVRRRGDSAYYCVPNVIWHTIALSRLMAGKTQCEAVTQVVDMHTRAYECAKINH